MVNRDIIIGRNLKQTSVCQMREKKSQICNSHDLAADRGDEKRGEDSGCDRPGNDDDLQSRKGSDRFLQTFNVVGRGRSSWTYPSKSQSHLEHEMGTEYNQEVPRRILRDGSQKRRAPDI